MSVVHRFVIALVALAAVFGVAATLLVAAPAKAAAAGIGLPADTWSLGLLGAALATR